LHKLNRTGNVAVIGEEAFTQGSWDDAFNSGDFIARYQLSIGRLPKSRTRREDL